MDDYSEVLNKMVAPRQLMNSYKLFMVKVIFSLCHERRQQSNFYEIGCRMVAYSWPYVLKKNGRLRHFDKLYDVVVLAIETEGLLETASTQSIIDDLINTKDHNLRREIINLTNYVPYRLLSHDMNDYLEGKTDTQKNRLIEELSQSSDSIYLIDKKMIYIRRPWYNYIVRHYKELDNWIDENIKTFLYGTNLKK